MKLARTSLSVALVLLSLAAYAQSDAQKSFETLKNLAGTWEGTFEGKPIHLSLRVTSTGNALLHEIRQEGKPDDPITMIYLEGDRLLLTHYCDAGNRPRMVARASLDRKTVEFDFLDVAGGTQYGHMDHAVFTIIDVNHHSEDWTYMLPGDKPFHAHMDLQRTN